MFRLFKEVHVIGGHEEVTRRQAWGEMATLLGSPGMGKAMEQTYMRYLSDFEVRLRRFSERYDFYFCFFPDVSMSCFPVSLPVLVVVAVGGMVTALVRRSWAWDGCDARVGSLVLWCSTCLSS